MPARRVSIQSLATILKGAPWGIDKIPTELTLEKAQKIATRVLEESVKREALPVILVPQLNRENAPYYITDDMPRKLATFLIATAFLLMLRVALIQEEDETGRFRGWWVSPQNFEYGGYRMFWQIAKPKREQKKSRKGNRSKHEETNCRDQEFQDII